MKTKRVTSAPQPRKPAPGKTAEAFTLLEVILAVTIAGAVLAAAATLMVSVTNAWLERQDRHFFEDHVDGVTEFLQACFSSAGSEIALESSEENSNSNNANSDSETENPNSVDVSITAPDSNQANGEETNTRTSESEDSTGGGLIRTSEDPIAWAKPPGYADYQDPLLHFGLTETPPLIIQNDDAPVVGIQAFLHFDQEDGLSLLWYTPLQEDSEDINDLRRTPISELIKGIQYVYWDERFEKWEEESEPKEGEGDEEFILPRFLKLTFEYEGETKERTLTIPVPSTNALIF